ncbi:hypothetical protein [Paenibacillus sp. 1P07SE]|uniref:hypothetical protein n=1 Tax=Paenibacillus sp. 1P07SE TaxID=3132209 RepID=UPI0039A759FA
MKEEQPLVSIALTDRRFVDRLTGKYGWLANRSIRSAGFVYLTPSRRSLDARGATDLHIHIQTSYANYYLKLLQTFRMETKKGSGTPSRELQDEGRRSPHHAGGQRDAGRLSSARSAEDTPKRRGSEPSARIGQPEQARRRATPASAEQRLILRTIRAETARLESLRQSIRQIASQEAPREQRDRLEASRRKLKSDAVSSPSTAAERRAGGAQYNSASDVSRTLAERRGPVRERLLRTSEHMIRVSYERMTRLQTMQRPHRQSTGAGQLSTGGAADDHIASRQDETGQRGKRTATASALGRAADRGAPTPAAEGGTGVRRSSAAASQLRAALVHRDQRLQMARWPRADAASSGRPSERARARELTARRVAAPAPPAQPEPRVAPPASSMQPERRPEAQPRPVDSAAVRKRSAQAHIRGQSADSAAVRLRSGRQLLPETASQLSVRRGTIPATAKPGGVSSGPDLGAAVREGARFRAAAPGKAADPLMPTPRFRSPGLLPVGGVRASSLAEDVRSRLSVSPLADKIRITALPLRSRPPDWQAGQSEAGQPDNARPSAERSYKRVSAVLIHSKRAADGTARGTAGVDRVPGSQAAAAGPDRPAISPGPGARPAGTASRLQPEPSRKAQLPGSNDASRSAEGGDLPGARRGAGLGRPQRDTLGAASRAMLLSGSARIRDWLMRTVSDAVPAPRLTSPAAQMHAKPMTGGRGLLQRIQTRHRQMGRAPQDPQGGSQQDRQTLQHQPAHGSDRLQQGQGRPAQQGQQSLGRAGQSLSRQERTGGTPSPQGQRTRGEPAQNGSRPQRPLSQPSPDSGWQPAAGAYIAARGVLRISHRQAGTRRAQQTDRRSGRNPVSGAEGTAQLTSGRASSASSRQTPVPPLAGEGDTVQDRQARAARLTSMSRTSMPVGRAEARGDRPLGSGPAQAGTTAIGTTAIGTTAWGRPSSDVFAMATGPTGLGSVVEGAPDILVDHASLMLLRSPLAKRLIHKRSVSPGNRLLEANRRSALLSESGSGMPGTRNTQVAPSLPVTGRAGAERGAAAASGNGRTDAARTVGRPGDRRTAIAQSRRSATGMTMLRPMSTLQQTDSSPGMAARAGGGRLASGFPLVATRTGREQPPRPGAALGRGGGLKPSVAGADRSRAAGPLAAHAAAAHGEVPLSVRAVPTAAAAEQASGTVREAPAPVMAPAAQPVHAADVTAKAVRRHMQPRPAMQMTRRSAPQPSGRQAGAVPAVARRTPAMLSAKQVMRPPLVRPVSAMTGGRTDGGPPGAGERELHQRLSLSVPVHAAGREQADGHGAEAEPAMGRTARQLPSLLHKQDAATSAGMRPAARQRQRAAAPVPLEFAVSARASARDGRERDSVIRKSLSRLEGELKELRTQPGAPAVDVRAMADQVYREITRRMRFEQQRRGL